MHDEQLAHAVRNAISQLNDTLADAARAGLSVTVRTTAHQTAIAGIEQLVVDARILKQL